MEYSKLKEELHQLIDQVNDEAALYQVRSILEAQTGHDWADDMSDELREALERSIAQADAGNVIRHEEAIRCFERNMGKEKNLIFKIVKNLHDRLFLSSCRNGEILRLILGIQIMKA